MTLFAIHRRDKVANARRVIERAFKESGARFIGLENVTKERVRKWSIAPVPPKKAIAALTGNGHPSPDHIMRVWSADCYGWRSVDLSTVRSVSWRNPYGVKMVTMFEG